MPMPPPIPPEKRDLLYQFYDSFNTPEEFAAKHEDLMRGIAPLKFLAGFCYTQLANIEQEINGLLTFDRHPKVPAHHIYEIHREVFRDTFSQT